MGVQKFGSPVRVSDFLNRAVGICTVLHSAPIFLSISPRRHGEDRGKKTAVYDAFLFPMDQPFNNARSLTPDIWDLTPDT